MQEMTVDKFNLAMRAGLGRCVLFLRGCADKEKYREIVLRACLNDYAYDGQCEGTRAWYAYELLSCFNDDGYFYSRTAAKLANVFSGNGEAWEFEHLFDMVFEFARHGNDGAKGLIQKIYAELLNRLAVKTPEPYKVDYDAQWFEHVCIECVQAGGKDAYGKIVADVNELCRRNAEYGMDDFEEIMSYYAHKSENKVKRTRAKTERKNKCDISEILRDIERYDNTDVDGEWHGVALDIVNNENTVFPIAAYMYVYTGLCACCRNGVVEAMLKHGLLSDELIKECEFDSYAETRELIKSINN